MGGPAARDLFAVPISRGSKDHMKVLCIAAMAAVANAASCTLDDKGVTLIVTCKDSDDLTFKMNAPGHGDTRDFTVNVDKPGALWPGTQGCKDELLAALIGGADESRCEKAAQGFFKLYQEQNPRELSMMFGDLNKEQKTTVGQSNTTGTVAVAACAGAAGGIIAVAMLLMLSRRFTVREPTLLG